MKEILKSKGMICFILFFLCISYFNTCNINKVNNESYKSDKIINNS